MKTKPLHPEIVLDNLASIEDAILDSNFQFEELSLKDTLEEIRRMVLLNVAKKPNGTTYCSNQCPTCGSRIRSGQGSSSRVRDDRCRKCGQLIDWT